MSSASLSTDNLRRRVAGTVGRLDAGALTQPVMRPERGYVSLVSCSTHFVREPKRRNDIPVYMCVISTYHHM
jgi:hypothetical protein